MRLSSISAVAVRDFLAVVRTKGFVIGLLFMPCILFVSTKLESLLERFGEKGERRYALADFTGKLAGSIEERIAARQQAGGEKLTVKIETVATPSLDDADGAGGPGGYEAARDALAAQFGDRIRADTLYGYVILGPRALEIPPPPSATPPPAVDPSEVVYAAKSLTAGNLKQVLRDAVNGAVRAARLESVGVDPALAGRIDRGVELRERIVGKESVKGGEKSSSAQEAIVPMVLSILLLMGVLQSAGLLLTSTIEEKSNRVVEVLVSSVSPFELLAGKVLGAWFTGMVMILAWGGAGAYAASSAGWLRAGTMSPVNLAWFVYFFLFGYLLFASLYAAIGAMCNSIQDAQSMMLPVMLLIMIPMLSLGFVLNHPDSALSVGLTWFPFSAPIIAVMRLALSPPAPQWQIAIAAAIVAVTALFMLWLGGKVFRTAILMTGKPPKPSEVLRMLREA